MKLKEYINELGVEKAAALFEVKPRTVASWLYAERTPSGKPRTVSLRYLLSPIEIRGDGRVEEVVLAVNDLVVGPDGVARAVPTDRRETIPCGLVLRSVGYRGVALDGVGFDDATGTIANAGGRALDPAGAPLAGEYCAGWIKRGPSGVIGTNKRCAADTVARILEDVAAGRVKAPTAPDPDAIVDLLARRGVQAVTQAGWLAIDEHELERGGATGRPRVKVVSRERLLALSAGS